MIRSSRCAWRLASASRRAIAATLPSGPAGGSRADDLAWRLVAQLSLDFLSLAEAGEAATPLRALLELYADRGGRTRAMPAPSPGSARAP